MIPKLLRIGYVREHFAAPLLQFERSDQDRTFVLVECPSGSGQLIQKLTNNEIDVAIALTDPLIASIANGSEAYKLVGSYVKTPLKWAVITGKDSKYNEISDLKDTTLGISRKGRQAIGSQTMAYVMGMQQQWPAEGLKFQINNDIRGLINSVNDGSTSAFMWEWFTTKPFVDSGDVRFIGNVPTPWPSWMIAARPTTPHEDLEEWLLSLTSFVRYFDSFSSRLDIDIEYIKEKFGYPEEDIKAWLATVGYPQDCLAIPEQVIPDTLEVLEKAGVVTKPEGGFDVNNFIDSSLVKLVKKEDQRR